MRKILPIILIFFLFFTCSKVEKKLEKEPSTNFKLAFNTYLKSHYKNILLSNVETATLDSINLTDVFYKAHNYEGIWINDSIELTQQGKLLIDTLSNAKFYGLTARVYQTTTLAKL